MNSHQQLAKADMLMFNESYDRALELYQYLFQKDTANSYLKFQIALCYSYMDKFKDSQIRMFCGALKYKVPASIDITYVYKGYSTYLDVDSGLCVNLKRKNLKPFRFNFQETYDNICISENNQYMAFVNTTNSKNQIYFLQRIGNQWTNAENITSQVGSMANCFPSFISKDGKRMYFTRYDNFDSEIYMSTFDGIKWSLIKKLNTNINSPYWDAHACESPDGLLLYFASNRPGGYGGMDIYYSVKVDGDWKKIYNCGNRINTYLDEDYPLLVDNGQTIIYSSQGFSKGANKFDLYCSQSLANFIWTEPIEVGFPFNTIDDDFTYVPLNELSRSFFYRKFLNAHRSSKTSYELYVKTELRVNNTEAKHIGNKRVVLSNLNDEQDVKSVDINSNSKYTSFPVNEGIYKMEFKGDGLESREIQLLVPAVPTVDTMVLKISLNPSKNIEDLSNTNIWKPLK
jgi:hypothetical protein